MSKLGEYKVFRDPIHGYVRVNDSVVWDCIMTKEFQRLKRIRQLGSTSMIYHTGEHSRFAHSLGVYEIIRRMVNEVEDLNENLTDYEKLTVMLAGLLHDIGHAPFSHSFESIMQRKHEEYTIQIILQPSNIHSVLVNYRPDLPHDVAAVIDGTSQNPILCQLVSSQLDADRMDYLLRDSYFTGTKYGEFDLERILRTMRVCDGKLVVKASGIHTIEDYIMARYHMYWQVYYHPVSRSYDAALKQVFKRLLDLYHQDPTIINQLPMYQALFTKKSLTNEEFYDLDDSVCFYSFHLMSKMDDPILSDLAKRVLERNLFKYMATDQKNQLVQKCLEKGYDPNYYIFQDLQTQSPYKPYDGQTHCIWVLMEDMKTTYELSEVSTIVSAICANNKYQDAKVFYPKEVL